MIVNTKIKVRYYETDQMGIVHHSNYLRWFEVGRTELLELLNLPYNKLEEKNILLPVIESKCKYIKATQYGDEVIVQTKVESIIGIRIKLAYKVINNNKDILVEGYTEHVFTNDKLKPINIKKYNLDLYKNLVSCIEK